MLLKTGLEARLKDEVGRARKAGETRLEDSSKQLERKMRNERESEVSKMGEEHNSKTEALKEAHGNEIEEMERILREAHTASVRELRDELRREQEEKLNQLEDDLKASHEVRVNELYEKHEAALQSVLNQDEQTLATVRTALREELTTSFEFSIDSLKKEHVLDLESEKKAAQDILAEKEAAMKEETERLATEIKKAKVVNGETIQKMEQSFLEAKEADGKQLETLQASLTAALAYSQSSFSATASLESELESLKKQAELDTTASEEQKAREIESLKVTNAAEINSIRAKAIENSQSSALKLEKTFANHATELKELQNEISQFKKVARKEFEEATKDFQAREKALKDQVERLVEEMETFTLSRRESVDGHIEQETHLQEEVRKLTDEMEQWRMSRRDSTAGHYAKEDELRRKLQDAEAHMFDFGRLVLYSSDTPDKEDFSQMIRCQKEEYDFETADLKIILAKIEKTTERAKKELGDDFKGFKSIALACHGPPKEADGDGDDDEGFEWKISEKIVITDDTEITEKRWNHPARTLMMELGKAVENKTGRVDLFACSLLSSREGNEVFDAIETETSCNFAASTNLTGNPKGNGDWIMESDGIDVRAFYFWENDEFDGTFESHLEPPKMQETRLALGKAEGAVKILDAELKLVRSEAKKLEEKLKEEKRERAADSSRHKEAVENLRKEYEETMEDFKASRRDSTANHESILLEVKKARSASSADHAEMLAAERKRGAEELRKLEEAMKGSMTEQKQELEKERAEVEGELKKVERELKEEVARMKKMHESTVEEAESAQSTALEKLKAEHKEALESVKRDRTSSSEEHKAAIEKVKATQAEALKESKAGNVEEIAKLKAAHKEEIKRVEETMEDFKASTENHLSTLVEVRSANASVTKEITELRKDHEEAVSNLQEEHTEAMKLARRNRTQSSLGHDEKLAIEKAQALASVLAIKQSHAEERKKLDESHANEVSLIRIASEASNKKLEANLQDIARMRAQSTQHHNEALKSAKDQAIADKMAEAEAHKKLLMRLDKEKRAAEDELEALKNAHNEKIEEFVKETQELLTLEKKKVKVSPKNRAHSYFCTSHASSVTTAINFTHNLNSFRDSLRSSQVASKVFKEERKRNLKEVGRLKQTYKEQLKEAQAQQEQVQRGRKASTEDHMSALQMEKMRAAGLIQIREKELEVTKKQAELMAAEMEETQSRALVELAEDERNKRSVMIQRKQEEHEKYVKEMKNEMERLQNERDALQREMDKCSVM